MSRARIFKIIFSCLLIIINGCVLASSSENLAESDHPYQDNYKDNWTITEPDAAQMRLHFEYLKLAYDEANWEFSEKYDRVILLDKYDNELKTYSSSEGISYRDFWTDWYEGDTIKVKIVTDEARVCDGFVIDKMETRPDETNSSSEVIDNSESPVSEVPPDDTRTDENKVLTVTELTSSTDYSTLGQLVTLVAKVYTSSDETEEPFGTVTFMDGTTPLGVRDLISGQATFNTSSLLVSSHSITAIYSGDINFKSSTSSPLILTVQEQPTSEEPSNTEEQPSTEQLANSEDEPSAKQNSLVKDILAIVSENPLVSGLIILAVSLIIENKMNRK